MPKIIIQDNAENISDNIYLICNNLMISLSNPQTFYYERVNIIKFDASLNTSLQIPTPNDIESR